MGLAVTVSTSIETGQQCIAVRLTMAILTCGKVAMLLRMTVNTAQSTVFLRTIDEQTVYALMTASTHIVGNILSVLNIGR